MTIIQLKYAVAVAESKSMQEAARREYISQPNLSNAVKALEDEIGTQLFERSRCGVKITNAGREFISYARQVLEQYQLMEEKYIINENKKMEFNVSTQHYPFAVNAFIDITKKYGKDRYKFSIIETQTRKVIDDVTSLRSDIGIIGFNSYNRKILMKLFEESNLMFHEIMQRETYVYLRKEHPLANAGELTLEQLEEYPCIIFEQGDNTSFYFMEEAFSTYQYPRIIQSNDRATSMELLAGLNGYAIGTGLLKNSVNGMDYLTIPLKEKEMMIIGYITRKDVRFSDIAKDYIGELEKYKDKKE
jgi:DNA-binding transcriptional LysR family regulator